MAATERQPDGTNGSPQRPVQDRQMTMRLDDCRRRQLRLLATEQGVTSSDWVRAVIDEAHTNAELAELIGARARSLGALIGPQN